jgi:small redox-active disulfide protein 2
MLQVTVYGPGCARCFETERRLRMAVERLGIEAEVRTETDFAAMAKAGALTTPAVAVNGTMRSTGRIPSEDEINGWLAETSSAAR